MTSWSGRAENFFERRRLPNWRKLIMTHLPYLCDGHAPRRLSAEGEIFEIPHARGLDIIDILKATVLSTNAASVYYIMREMDGEPHRRFSVSGNYFIFKRLLRDLFLKPLKSSRRLPLQLSRPCNCTRQSPFVNKSAALIQGN